MSRASLTGATNPGDVKNARILPPEQWTYPDPLRIKAQKELHEIETRLSSLQVGDQIKANAKSHFSPSSPTHRHPSSSPSPSPSPSPSVSRRFASSSPSPSLSPPPPRSSSTPNHPHIPPQQVVIPRVEARRQVRSNLDKKSAKVIDSIMHDYHDHLKSLAIQLFDEQSKLLTGRKGAVESRLEKKRLASLENCILRSVEVELERLRSRLPQQLDMRTTLMQTMREEVREQVAQLEERLRQHVDGQRRRQTTLVEEGDYSSSDESDIMRGEMDDAYETRSPSRLVRRASAVSNAPSWRDEAAAESGDDASSRAHGHRAVTFLNDTASVDTASTSQAAARRRSSFAGTSASISRASSLSAPTIPARFYFYDGPLDASSSSFSSLMPSRSMSLSRRASISNSAAFNSVLGTNSNASSLDMDPPRRVQRRASMVGVLRLDTQEKSSAMSESDTAILEYIKGQAPEVPPMARFHTALHLNHMGLDTVLLKEREAFSRLETLLRLANGAENIDLSYNNLDPSWLGHLMSLLISTGTVLRLKRLDLTGNRLANVPEDNEVTAESEREQGIPPVPTGVLFRANAIMRPRGLGDFFILVDQEQERRSTWRPAVQVQQQEQEVTETKKRREEDKEDSVTLGTRALGKLLARLAPRDEEPQAPQQDEGAEEDNPSAASFFQLGSRSDEAENQLQALILRSTGLIATSLPPLVEGLAMYRALQELDLSQNSLGPHCGPALAAILIACPHLQALALAWCDLGPAALRDLVAAAFYSPESPHCLAALDISHNDLTSEGALELATWVRGSGTLRELHCSSCRITSAGAFAMAKGLLDQSSTEDASLLRLLNLKGNDLGQDGVNALKTAVRDRVLKSKASLLLFANNYDHDSYISTLTRLAKQSGVGDDAISNSGSVATQDQRGRLQRRASMVNAGALVGGAGI